METQTTQTDWRHLPREERGELIAKRFRITKTERGYIVPSQSGSGSYLVSIGQEPKCTCPDCELRKVKCKHIFAVEYTLKHEIDQEGNLTISKSVRVSYPQDWRAYNQAQTKEGELFMKLLADLCTNIEQPIYEFGRPKLPLSDMLFASALKVYSTFSLRRFMSDVKIALENGYIDKTCSYVSVSNYMRDPQITPILHDMIKLSSLPLSSVETKFANDSTGFSTSRFARYYSFKHGKDMRYNIWIKAHLTCGVKTNIITAVRLTEGEANDCPYFKPLMEETAENFKVEEATADLAYSSRDNHELINSFGGIAYIPFKSNATGKARGSLTWKRMYHYFQFNRDEYMTHYHLRSNAETTVHMIKSKFRDNVRSKDKTAQFNEVLLKVLCHNICVVIQEMHELGIEADFCLKSQEDVKKVGLN